LDLGTGIAGLTCALLGADVTLTDTKEVLELLQRNVDANKSNIRGNVTVLELDWNNGAKDFEKFDYVLGADLVFNIKVLEPLAKILQDVCSEQAKILFAHKPRHDEVDEQLFETLEKYNFTGDEFENFSVEGQLCEWIRLFTIRLISE
jgi:predicted nicotinamide N-methyase